MFQSGCQIYVSVFVGPLCTLEYMTLMCSTMLISQLLSAMKLLAQSDEQRSCVAFNLSDGPQQSKNYLLQLAGIHLQG